MLTMMLQEVAQDPRNGC